MLLVLTIVLIVTLVSGIDFFALGMSGLAFCWQGTRHFPGCFPQRAFSLWTHSPCWLFRFVLAGSADIHHC